MIVAVFAEGRLEIKGHAGFNPGNDVVCAGVSAIAYALLGYLSKTTAHLEYADKPGAFHCMATGPGVAAAMEMARVGIMQIANHYPDYVRVVET